MRTREGNRENKEEISSESNCRLQSCGMMRPEDFMKRILFCAIFVLALSLASAHNAFAMAQITMVNKSQLQLSLYISDDNGLTFYFGCGPVLGVGQFTNSAGMFCTSSVAPGIHLLEAREGDKVITRRGNFKIEDGTSPTWTVDIPGPPKPEGDVTITGEYLGTDSSGWHYGARVHISSTVNDFTCTVIIVTTQTNLSGSVKSPIQLGPNEKNVSIGEFRAIKHGENGNWKVAVTHEKFTRGACPRQ
jgi:hypothetical protein